jgi:hypothetical protein
MSVSEFIGQSDLLENVTRSSAWGATPAAVGRSGAMPPSKAKRAWVARILGVEMATPKAPLADASILAGGIARLMALRDEAGLYGALDGFREALQAAAVALKANDPGALDQIQALEEKLAATAAAKHAQEAAAMMARLKTASGMGVVSFNKLRLRLDDARSRIAGAIENLKAACEALLETEEFAEDPRSALPETQAAIDALDQRVPSAAKLIDGLEDSLDLMMQASDPAVRAGHAQAALNAIQAYRQGIDGDPLLAVMEHTDAGDFAIRGTMTAVLDELATALRG